MISFNAKVFRLLHIWDFNNCTGVTHCGTHDYMAQVLALHNNVDLHLLNQELTSRYTLFFPFSQKPTFPANDHTSIQSNISHFIQKSRLRKVAWCKAIVHLQYFQSLIISNNFKQKVISIKL